MFGCIMKFVFLYMCSVVVRWLLDFRNSVCLLWWWNLVMYVLSRCWLVLSLWKVLFIFILVSLNILGDFCSNVYVLIIFLFRWVKKIVLLGLIMCCLGLFSMVWLIFLMWKWCFSYCVFKWQKCLCKVGVNGMIFIGVVMIVVCLVRIVVVIGCFVRVCLYVVMVLSRCVVCFFSVMLILWCIVYQIGFRLLSDVCAWLVSESMLW